MPRALKVFRTPIGFHDAYVAVPTKKAALEAWGSSANLFARGLAEEVSDPTLTKAPLAAPGTVVKVARGTTAEHVAALGKVVKSKRGAGAHPTPNPAPQGEGSEKPKPAPKPKPKPKRDRLDAAEAAFREAEQAQRAARDELAAREKALADERRALERTQAAERATLEQARDKAERDYASALTKWRG